MIAALIADTAFLDESLDAFRRLIVGLLDEQVQAVQVVPASLGEAESISFSKRVTWRESPWAWLRQQRLGKLADPLDDLDVDIVHALDQRLWHGALSLASQLGTPLVLGASSSHDVVEASRIASRLGDVPTAFATTSEPITRALRDALPPGTLIQTVLPGVHCPSESSLHEVCSNPDAVCAVISGSGAYDDDYAALFGALRPVVRERPLSQFFLDGMGNDQHELWQNARRQNLLSHMSTLPRQLGHREMLLQADLLIQPQPLGQTRTFVLQAMAHAIPLLAREDAWIDYLVDGTTARLVHEPTVDAWTTELNDVFEQTDRLRALGRQAREWVRENRVGSHEVESMIALYREVSGASYRFRDAQDVAGKTD